MKKIVLAAVALSILSGNANAADHYRMSGYGAEACEHGPEGQVEIGNGYFRVGETVYERAGERRKNPDGSFTARYDLIAEGEPQGAEEATLLITGKGVVIRFADGESVTASACR